VALLVVYVAASIVIGTVFRDNSNSHVNWLVKNQSTIQILNQDQDALRTDSPASGGQTARWVTDWHRLHDDAVTAASLPNPGGTATVPWREMLNDYANGSTEIIQSIQSNDAQELTQAERVLQAGVQAATRFNQAMSVSSG
jgi:hypothetical protein